MDLGSFGLYVCLFVALYFEVFLMISFFEKRPSKKDRSLPAYYPSVSMLVPCFNEESTLASTIDSLLAMQYPEEKLEIVVIDDGSAAILVRLPTGTAAPSRGDRIEAHGIVASYFRAPQLECAEAPVTLEHPGEPAPIALAAASLDPALEWRLVRVSGTVAEVHRFGSSWRAELSVGGGRIPVYGGARSGIASTALVEGRTAAVTGVVRRPYPTASDRNYVLVPRAGNFSELQRLAAMPFDPIPLTQPLPESNWQPPTSSKKTTPRSPRSFPKPISLNGNWPRPTA